MNKQNKNYIIVNILVINQRINRLNVAKVKFLKQICVCVFICVCTVRISVCVYMHVSVYVCMYVSSRVNVN